MQRANVSRVARHRRCARAFQAKRPDGTIEGGPYSFRVYGPKVRRLACGRVQAVREHVAADNARMAALTRHARQVCTALVGAAIAMAQCMLRPRMRPRCLRTARCISPTPIA